MVWSFYATASRGFARKKNPEQTQVHLNVIIQKTAEASGGKFESQTERKNYVVLRNLSSYPMRVLLCRACALWSLTQPNAQHYLQTRQRERKKRWRCPVLWLYTIHVNGPIDNEKCDSSQKVASLKVWIWLECFHAHMPPPSPALLLVQKCFNKGKNTWLYWSKLAPQIAGNCVWEH